MSPVLYALSVVGLLAVGATCTGRALAGLCSLRLLRRATPENFIASAFLGTACWVLMFGWCSYLGLTARPAALLVVALSAALLAGLAWRRRLVWLLPPRRSGAWLLLAPPGLAVLVNLTPVLLGNSFRICTDAGNYAAASDWLQGHAFSAVCVADPRLPVSELIAFMQPGHRMGAIFLLAEMQALWPGSLGLEIYPGVIAWGVALNVGAVYVLCRWALRCRPLWACMAAVVAGCAANPVAFAASWGFLSQVYGTGALAFALAVLARLTTRAHWNVGGAFLFAATAAFLISAYSEIAPVLVVAGLVYLALAAARAWRSRRVRRFLSFAAVTVLLLALLGNVEHFRAVRWVLQMSVAQGCGWRLPWSVTDYWSFAVGARSYAALPAQTTRALAAEVVVAGVFTVVFAAGFVTTASHVRVRPLLTALLVLGALAAYQHWAVKDPWTGDVGQTWNQFKLCQWAFSLVVAVQGAGLHRLFRRPPWSRAAVGAICLYLAALAAPPQWNDALTTVNFYQSSFQNASPLAAVHRLQRRIEELNPSAIYYIQEPGEYWPCHLLPLLFPNRPIRADWPGAAPAEPAPLGDALCLYWGDPLFAHVRERLPCGITAIDSGQPALLRATYPNRDDPPTGAEVFAWLGPEFTELTLWAPRAEEANLSFTVEADADRPASTPVRILVAAAQGEPREITAACGAPVVVPLLLHPGANRVKLRCPDVPGLRLPRLSHGRIVLPSEGPSDVPKN